MKITLQEYLNEQPTNQNYIFLYYNEDGDNEDFDEYGIDEYDAADEALKIAKYGGINILRDKRLLGILIYIKISKVIGAIWVSDESDKFSFDVAIDSSYQNVGLSSILINSALDEYHSQQEAYDDLVMEVDVINPKLAQILKHKYGFHVVAELSQNRVLMSV